MESRSVRFAQRADSLFFIYTLDKAVATCILDCYREGVKLSIEAGPRCPANRIHALGRYVLAANDHLWGGRFDLDQKTGHLLYVQMMDFAEGELTDAMLYRLIAGSLHRFDQYVGGAMSVMFGRADPLQTIAEIEAPAETEDVGGEDAEGESDPDPERDREWVSTMERLMGMVDIEDASSDATDDEAPSQPSLWDEDGPTAA